MYERKIKKAYYKLINCYNNTIVFTKYKILKKNEYKLILQNEKYRDLHKGERCFIVGNGPSLKEQDLALLKNEVVITVNQIVRNEDFEKIKTNYHFWADPIFFNLSPDRPEDMELLEVFKSINTEDNAPKCFMPVVAQDFARKFELDKYIDINYYNSINHFYDGYKDDIDFTKFTPSFQTVVQWGISFAIFMGFSEIYLLGCDTTGIITAINASLGNDNSDTYGYKVTPNEMKRIKNMQNVIEIEEVFAGWTKIIHLYKELYEYSSNRNVRLVNCSAKTIIDSIPREKFENVISKVKYEKYAKEV